MQPAEVAIWLQHFDEMQDFGLVVGRTTEKVRKFCSLSMSAAETSNPRNDKALNNQGFVVSDMAEAMGFELMDLLQSTVFKSED
ncbi:hypothetical protein [Pseudomonas sp. AIG]